jgi:transcription elongation factor GreA
MNNEPQYLSKEKHAELEAELINLKTVERKEVAATLDYAKSLGDLSENAEYQEARDRQADIEDRIKEVEGILKNALIVSGRHTGTVDVGSKVTIKKTGGEAKEYLLVGSEEADMQAGKISHLSPIGGALVGKKKGEMVKVSTPKGMVEYTIVDVK